MAAVKRIALALVLALALVAAPLSTASSAEAVSTIRVQGADRFATAVEVSKWTEGWAAPRGTVYLASGLKFPDALAAAPVVAAEGGHLLLTRPEAVDATTMARIEAIDPATIVIVGSEASISANVATQLEAATDAQVERLGGRDRVETSLLITGGDRIGSEVTWGAGAADRESAVERLEAREGIAAGIHVPNSEGAGWNTEIAAKRFAFKPVVLIEWAVRRRGLILPPGNPGQVASLADLAGKRLAKRQQAAGSHEAIHRQPQAVVIPAPRQAPQQEKHQHGNQHGVAHGGTPGGAHKDAIQPETGAGGEG